MANDKAWQGGQKMIRLLSFLLLSFTLSAAEWKTDYEEVVKAAKKDGKAVLIDFYADWCGPCKQMEATTLKDDKVLNSLKGYILLKVDIDKNQKLAQKYRVTSIPHFVVLNRFEEVVSEVKGYRDADNFSEWIKSYSKQALSNSKVAELSAEDKKVFSEFSKSPVKSMELFSELFKASPEAKKMALIQNLQKLPVKDLKPSLSHDKLEIRLFAAGIIKQKDKSFEFDPWASKADREKMLQNLKEEK